jgi:ATP-dependent helicase HrpB
VRHVVDSGLVRRARFDPRRGLNTLWTVRADQKSAEQRAGRAGRTAAGDCLRLWDPRDLPPEDSLPEIARLELSGLWLQLLDEGAVPDALPWLDAPPSEAEAAAQTLLERLGALGADGAVTALGRELSKLPVSPRAARVLWEARAKGGLATALDWASEYESQGGDAHRLRERLRGMLGSGGSARVPLGRLLLPAFSDAVAVATDGGRWRLPDGRTAALDQSQQASPLLLALDVQETAARERGTSLRIRQAEPLDPDWAAEAFPRDSGVRQLLEWDARARRVVGREVFELFGQELSQRPLSDDRLDRLRAEEILSEKLADGTIRWAWGEAEDLWARRVRLAAALFPERELPRLDDDDLDLVRSALCEGCLAAAGVEGREVLPYLREAVGTDGCAFVESMLPLRLNLPNGKRAQIEYRDDGPPLVRARISDLIGLKSSQVRIAQGRISILWEILAPNHRPVQRTADLDGFWIGSYPEIRKDLARRYPKHPWP